MGNFAWEDFLILYNQKLMQDERIMARLPSDVIASGWLGYPGATNDRIAESEAHLGARLPSTYRAFLKVSNGWRHPTPFISKLWAAEEIEWFSVRNQNWIDTFVDAAGEDLLPVSDQEYFVYGEEQETANLRMEHLQTALEISDSGDGCVYLLNPQVVTAADEWEAWFFCNWLFGAVRFRSFQEMMEHEYRKLAQRRLGGNTSDAGH